MTSLSRAERNEYTIRGSERIAGNGGRRALNGAMISFSAKVAGMVFQVASAAILGRLLDPADFGLFAMAFTMTSLVMMFSDMGLSYAVVQRSEISQKLVSTLFYVNVVIALALMMGTVVLSPVAAWLYHDQRVAWLTIGLGLSIPISALGTQHSALLGRAMRWVPLQLANLVGMAFGLLFSVLMLIFFHVGYWALVMQYVAGTVSTVLVYWIACDWRPDFRCDWRSARSEINFGLNLVGTSMASWFHKQLDNILIGWYWGSTELGFYNRAYNMLNMPLNFINGPINFAITPLLSRVQSKPEEWRNYYVTALSGACFIGYLMGCLLFLNSASLIAIVLGPKWAVSSTIFSLLAISMFASTPVRTMNWIYISLARTDRMFRWGIVNAACCSLAFVFGLPYHAIGVAAAYSITYSLLAVPALTYATRGSHIGARQVLRTILGPLTVALIVILTTRFAMAELPHHGPLFSLILTSAIAGTLYLVLAGALVLLDPTYAGFKAAVMHVLIPLLHGAGLKASVAAAGADLGIDPVEREG